ncbi:phosphotransferase family protein [Halomonas sp. M4R1S46]|uniref:phosphotransferase family protein n=1 Tax=Halomonas sp. M4R1S46 TaxID=2982692 RepID=UPI0021E4B7EB|nr:aminoglycoside phosphotransferase family protein [Halomonas sp. M4R1S46]UYG06921.1 aminoglycoside phosphotransferase family protein [Halomonas sp. M4R1S46]
MPETSPHPADTDRRDADTLLARLTRALARAGELAAVRELTAMADTGLAHWHVWLHRSGDDLVARIPKQSQMGLPARDNLAYQAACFARAAVGGHAPALHGRLPPDADLPRGALLVEAIVGRPARLPEDLAAIARSLAGLHRLPRPPVAERAPLQAPDDPWRAMREEVLGQAAALPEAGLGAEARRLIEAQLAALPDRLPGAAGMARLISFDAHPGNFLVEAGGRAVLVDLEKCRYGLPGFDLAHASLYTSTTWDLASRAVLSLDQVAGFHDHWREAMGMEADTHPPDALLACRRAMWLWSLTWCAKWRVAQGRRPRHPRDGEDWSAALSEEALVAHVRGRVDHYLEPATLRRGRDELDALAARSSRSPRHTGSPP